MPVIFINNDYFIKILMPRRTEARNACIDVVIITDFGTDENENVLVIFEQNPLSAYSFKNKIQFTATVQPFLIIECEVFVS